MINTRTARWRVMASSGQRTIFRMYALWAALALAICAHGCSDNDGGSFMGEGDSSATAQRPFLPKADDLIIDKSTGLKIVRDVINITFSPGTTDNAAKKIITQAGGKIVGYDLSANLYHVRFKGIKPADMDKLRIKLLREHKEVEIASRMSVSVHKDPYYVR